MSEHTQVCVRTVKSILSLLLFSLCFLRFIDSSSVSFHKGLLRSARYQALFLDAARRAGKAQSVEGRRKQGDEQTGNYYVMWSVSYRRLRNRPPEVQRRLLVPRARYLLRKDLWKGITDLGFKRLIGVRSELLDSPAQGRKTQHTLFWDW